MSWSCVLACLTALAFEQFLRRNEIVLKKRNRALSEFDWGR